MRAQVAHHREDLVVGLAQADHQAGLGRHVGVARLEVAAAAAASARSRRPGAPACRGAARSRGCGSSRRAAPRRGSRARGRAGRGSPAPGSRCACRGDSSRTARMQSTKCCAPPSRRSSRSTLVITTYASFSAAMVCARLARLVGVERLGPAVGDVAERAAARAQVAQDHEGRGALAEALADVRAGGFLAHRVQLLLAQDLLDLVEARPGAGARTRIQSGFFSALLRHDLDRDARGLGARPSACRLHAHARVFREGGDAGRELAAEFVGGGGDAEVAASA